MRRFQLAAWDRQTDGRIAENCLISQWFTTSRQRRADGRVLLTGDVEASLGAAQRDAGRHVGRDAAERAVVVGALDARDDQVAVELVASARVGQLAPVQRPVERYLAPVRHVAAQQRSAALDHVLVDRRRVEVETVLLLRLRHRYTHAHMHRTRGSASELVNNQSRSQNTGHDFQRALLVPKLHRL